ncbi:MAG: hypothetical protein AseanaTS_04870 [Candidatus Pelagadaptatus aseana]
MESSIEEPLTAEESTEEAVAEESVAAVSVVEVLEQPASAAITTAKPILCFNALVNIIHSWLLIKTFQLRATRNPKKHRT